MEENKRIKYLHKIIKTILSCKDKKTVCGVEQDYKAFYKEGIKVVDRMIENYVNRFNIRYRDEIKEILVMLYYINLDYDLDKIEEIFTDYEIKTM